MTAFAPSESYAVHIDGEGRQLPVHPGPGWTRFVCISDTHSRTNYRVPPGDVLLHAGDLSSWGQPSQLATTIEWLKSLDHPTKIIVAGNHDLCLDRKWVENDDGWGKLDPEAIEQSQAYVRSQEAFGMHYLEHEPLHIAMPTGKVWRLYGSPAAPFYVLPGSFQYDSAEEAEAIYARVPDDTEILITHTPPHRTLDKTRRGKDAGCETLSSRVNELKDCRLHVFGHIHEAAGICVDKVVGAEVLRVSVNAAIERSEVAIVVDLRE